MSVRHHATLTVFTVFILEYGRGGYGGGGRGGYNNYNQPPPRYGGPAYPLPNNYNSK